MEKAFEQIANERIDTLRSSTRKPRTDSTMIASGIRIMSNVRRIFCCQASQNSSKAYKRAQKGPKAHQEQPVTFPFLVFGLGFEP